MNREAAKIFSKVILPDRKVRIKLLGDSITHGFGGTGFKQDGEFIATKYHRNPNGYCWAKLLKDYMEENFDCEVVNNGCSGTVIQFIIEYFDTLVDPEDDIIICTIGTNNRHQPLSAGPRRSKREQMERVYGFITQLQRKFRDAGKDVIFVANVPASAKNERDGNDYWRVIHMNDIHDLYVKASLEFGFPLIDLYTLFLGYCREHDLQVEDLLGDGLHPNDAGYEVMYRLILGELGIAEKVPGAEF